MNRKYQAGRRKEREIKLMLQACGFYVTRSSGSKGHYDLIAGKGSLTMAIQCKGKSVSKAERERLIENSKYWLVPHIMVWKKVTWMADAYVEGARDQGLAELFLNLLERGALESKPNRTSGGQTTAGTRVRESSEDH